MEHLEGVKEKDNDIDYIIISKVKVLILSMEIGNVKRDDTFEMKRSTCFHLGIHITNHLLILCMHLKYKNWL